MSSEEGNTNASATQLRNFPALGGGVGGGVLLRIWKGRDAPRKFFIKPLKETDLGVAQAFLDP